MNPNLEYSSLDAAFDFFNARLFEGTLPRVLLSLRNNPRSRGFFRSRAFVNRIDTGAVTDEIALCADTFSARTDKEILSTLVHEQCHLWQFNFGTPGRRGYHNAEFAVRMGLLGLQTSDTGLPGGRATGSRMTHYIIEGGPFDVAANELLATGWKLNWQENTPQVLAAVAGANGVSLPAQKQQTRQKYTCVKCGLAAWAKFTANLVCGTCGISMTAAT